MSDVTNYDVVRDLSVVTPIRVPSVQIGDLVGANYCNNSSRSGSTPSTKAATHPPGFANLLTKQCINNLTMHW